MRALTPLLLFILACGDKDGPTTDTVDSAIEDVDADQDGTPASLDCDDNNAAVHPEAVEVCDGVDNDCDGVVDTDATDMSLFYTDADADGFGDPNAPVNSCEALEGVTTDNTDCDDSDPDIHPDGVEICDGLDNDCDTLVDTDDPDSDGDTTLYADYDGDTWGNPGSVRQGCPDTPGYAERGEDCNDGEASINPEAPEICDGFDNDCDTLVDQDDDDVEGLSSWYVDADYDGYGDPNSSPVESCDALSGTSADGTDCDDTNYDINPGIAEICGDELDNNCDGQVDDGCSSYTGWTGTKRYESGFGAFGVRDCDMVWTTVGVPQSASTCPNCDFVFEVTQTYDTVNSVYSGACLGTPGDAVELLGYYSNYNGYPAVVSFSYGYAFGGLSATLDANTLQLTYSGGYRDTYFGYGYYFTSYDIGEAQLTQ